MAAGLFFSCRSCVQIYMLISWMGSSLTWSGYEAMTRGLQHSNVTCRTSAECRREIHILSTLVGYEILLHTAIAYLKKEIKGVPKCH